MIAVGKQPPPRYKAKPDAAVADQAPAPSPPRSAPSEKGGGPAAPSDPDAGRPEQDVNGVAEAPGADILADAMAPLLDLGLSPEEAKSTLGKMFTALAQCFVGKEPAGEEGMDFHQGSQQFGGGQ